MRIVKYTKAGLCQLSAMFRYIVCTSSVSGCEISACALVATVLALYRVFPGPTQNLAGYAPLSSRSPATLYFCVLGFKPISGFQ